MSRGFSGIIIEMLLARRKDLITENVKPRVTLWNRIKLAFKVLINSN